MLQLLVLVVSLTLAKGQFTSQSCLNSSICKNLTIDPTGLDLEKSPFYAIMSSNVTDSDKIDGSCYTYFHLGENIYLMCQTIVFKDGSYIILQHIRGNISGSPGAYRYQGIDPTLECESCVFNEFTIKALQGECEGLYLTYRCALYGDCVSKYSGQDFVFFVQSALLTSAAPSCCGSTANSLAQQQGLSPLSLLPNRLPHNCVTEINGLTAINADCVSPENSIQVGTSSSC